MVAVVRLFVGEHSDAVRELVHLFTVGMRDKGGDLIVLWAPESL